MQALGGAREAAFLGDGDERVEVAQLDGWKSIAIRDNS
jgi:hypothetical protein